MTNSRRQILAAAGGAAAALPGLLGACATAGRDAFNPRLLRAQQDVFADVEWMASLGPRYCGTPAHTTLVDYLDTELAKCGAIVDDIHHTALVQWAAREVSLKTPDGPLPIGAVCRWSASTGPQGVTAPLRYLGRAEGPSRFELALDPSRRCRIEIPSDVAGKIALLEIVVGPRQWGRMYEGRVVSVMDREGDGALPAVQPASASNQPALPDGFEAQLKAAGALGIIYAWTNLAEDAARGQARLGTDAMPSLWVTPASGARLRALSESSTPVTLTVDAEFTPNTPTRTVVATLPGQSEESILLWTHIDGQNAIEENATVGMVNMMRYFARLPQSARRRSITVVMPEGHFAEQYLPGTAWMRERPSLMANAVAMVAAEHLGCMEWVSDASANTYAPSGASELAFAFCPTAPMQALAQAAVADQRLGRQAIIGSDQFSLTPAMATYRIAPLPFFGFAVIPSYLLSDDANGHIAKLDPTLYYEQLKTLIRMVHAIDATPTEILRQP